MRSMDPQPFCALPWCGKAPGGPNKIRIVDGERLEYPAGIDAHHIFGRPGPVVYVCHECHMKHHDGRHRLLFEDTDDGLLVWWDNRGWAELEYAKPWDL